MKMEDFHVRKGWNLLRLVANNLRSAVIIIDDHRQIIFVNPTFTRLMGYELAETKGLSFSELLSGTKTDRASLARASTWGVLGSEHTEEVLLYGRNGNAIWMSVTVNPIPDVQEQCKQTIVVLSDISESKQLQLLQEKTLAAVAGALPILDVMESICVQVERMAPDVIATVLRVDLEGRIRPLAAPSLPESYTQALNGMAIGPLAGSCGTAAYRGEEVVVTDIATDPLWADYQALILPLGFKGCWSTPIKSRNGKVVGTFAFYYRTEVGPTSFQQRIVTACVHLCALALEREEANARILRLALYDELTGLPNRWLLREKVNQAIADGIQNGAQIAFLFLDLDRFKHINDSLGHPVGDQLLCTIARRLERRGRNGRIVGRLGGDEFVIALPDCNAERACVEVESVLESVSEPVQINGLSIAPSASIGISMFPHDGEDIDSLFKHADMAMYQAKASGRGKFYFFSHDLNQRAQERLVLETALREALNEHQLQLHYQPQVRLTGNTLHGVEALVRWHHPKHGDIAPNRFIPLAEECGLIDAIGFWVIAEACAQMADWRRRGIEIPSLSINLSPLQFRNSQLANVIGDALRTHGLNPGDLKLEITEGVMLDNSAQTKAMLETIHALGVKLALDDFGTGYSSLSHLGNLPLDELKVDQSFVRMLGEGPRARTLASAIIRLGESLRLTVIAEGVETEFQRRFLYENGCHVIQGFLLARPLPVVEFEAWLLHR